MNKEFVSYKQALALKELGFDEECFAFYNGKFLDSTDYNFDDGTSKDIGLCIKAPLKQQVFRWFREKYELIASIRHNKFPDMSGKQYYFEYEYKNSYERYITYEEAENACIDKLIEIAKQK
jgi:hypothetical protein